jgi:hypothetical protein
MDSHTHSAQVGRLEVVDTGRRRRWSDAHARRSITRERDQSGRLEANRENRIGGPTAGHRVRGPPRRAWNISSVPIAPLPGNFFRRFAALQRPAVGVL